MPRILKTAWWLLLCVSAISVLESSFEMYVLTLSGAQMLFFSIVHTESESLLLILLGSAACFLALMIFNVLIVAAASIKVSDGGLRKQAPTVAVLLFQITHTILLVSYDGWSAHGPLRIALALTGLAFLTFIAIKLAVVKDSSFTPGAIRAD